MGKKLTLRISIGGFITGLVLLIVYLQFFTAENSQPIRIGILHSLSGTMADSEIPLVETLLMAVDEINQQGGLIGRQIEAITVDGRSDPAYFAREAERLIKEEKVEAIFGCWTSTCRKAVKPVVEKHDNILFYALQYEGLEQSNNIVYTGATPNQQIIPGVIWTLNNLGKRIYLIGSDYIFPRTANFIIHDVTNLKNTHILGERYVPLGSNNFKDILSDVIKLQPDVIINTLNGTSNHSFFELKHQMDLDHIPVMSFSLTEVEIDQIPAARTENHYATWNYFQSIESDENKAFVAKIKQRMGPDQKVGDPMEASYIAFQLWVQAVKRVTTTTPKLVYRAISDLSLSAPEGIVSLDRRNHHLFKKTHVGQAQPNGQFTLLWQSKYPIRPIPYPSYRTRSQWIEAQKNIKAGRSAHDIH